MKSDSAAGGQMWCLRRNALGYGLYEVGVESTDGPLKGLSDDLSEALRATTVAGISESTEEVSTTWKLLETAENVSNFFSAWTPGPSNKESGSVTKIDSKKDHADTLFEKRQREQVQSSAKTLRLHVEKLANVEFAALPFDLRCRVQRVCAVLRKADRVKQGNNGYPGNSGDSEESEVSLTKLIELCAKIERNGNLASQVRQEFTSLVAPLVTDLEAQARQLRVARPRTESDKENAENQGTTQNGSPKKLLQSQQPFQVPLLPPPPRSSNGIASAQLTF